MTASPARSNTTRIWIITVVALIVVFYVVHLMTRGKLPVRVATVVVGNFEKPQSTNGKVEPQPQFNYEAHAPYPGLVRQIYVHAGEKVPAGKLLLAMDDTDARSRVAAALAALKGAQAAWQAAQHGGTQEEVVSLNGEMQRAIIDRDQAQHDYDALQKLAATGAASPSEVSAAKERLDADNSSIQVIQQRQSSRYGTADLAHVKASLDEAQAAYDAAVASLNQALVHAPFSGTVYALPVSPTEYVQQGELLLSIADPGKLQVMAYFDEPDIGELAVGQPATITWDARPDQVWHGHVLRLPSTVITYLNTRNVGEVPISVDDADDALLPDTNVQVTVTVARESNVLIVSHDALHHEEGQNCVYRVENNMLHRVPITIGQSNLTSMQILSGLKAGDQVALTTTVGQPLIDGEPIKVVD
jgi:HlyD family secretion protein